MLSVTATNAISKATSSSSDAFMAREQITNENCWIHGVLFSEHVSIFIQLVFLVRERFSCVCTSVRADSRTKCVRCVSKQQCVIAAPFLIRVCSACADRARESWNICNCSCSACHTSSWPQRHSQVLTIECRPFINSAFRGPTEHQFLLYLVVREPLRVHCWFFRLASDHVRSAEMQLKQLKVSRNGTLHRGFDAL